MPGCDLLSDCGLGVPVELLECLSGTEPGGPDPQLGAGCVPCCDLTVEHGGFYHGHRTSATFNRTRVNLTPRFSLEPSVSINWIDLPSGPFTTTLAGSRVTYTMTPLMFASALVQYNSSTRRASTNVRLRWEYRPGSELFVVYNDERDTLLQRFPDVQNRAFIIKVTRLFRF